MEKQEKLLLGAHMSIAGGLHRAVDAAAALQMETVQIFTASPSQWSVSAVSAKGKGRTAQHHWRAAPLAAEQVELFRAQLASHKIAYPLCHASYLINLASPDAALWERSVAAMVSELERAEQLGIPYVVVHPGSHTDASEAAGIAKVILALDEIHHRTDGLAAQPLLENTAGQGTNLGWRFEQLGAMIAGAKQPDRLGVCFDTCHAFAAGYPLATAAEYQALWNAFDAAVGVARIKAIHLNDSKRELGARVDRHEHIGRGKLGLEPFRRLLGDRRFRKTPLYLETPKGDAEGESWDAINLRTLRELAEN